MAGLYDLFKAAVLLVNALAILNEKRFLRQCKLSIYMIVLNKFLKDGWDRPDPRQNVHQESSSVKNKIVSLLYGVRLVVRSKIIL